MSNSGGAALTGVTVTDDKIPTASIDCNGNTAGNGQPFALASGASVTCTASYTSWPRTSRATKVDNVATADSGPDHSRTDDWSIPLAAMTIDKVATSAGPFALGARRRVRDHGDEHRVATLHGVHIAEAGVGAVLDPACAALPEGAGVTLAPGTGSPAARPTSSPRPTSWPGRTRSGAGNSDETPDVTDSVTVETPDPAVDLAIVKTLVSSSLVVGQQATYRLTVSNNGPATATSITVSDTMPTGLSLVSATGPSWSCTIVSPKVTCTTPSALLSGRPWHRSRSS